MSRSESRKRQNSSNTRTKFDVELPKINKTTLMIRDKGKQNNFMHSSITVSFVDKVGWVVEPVDYDSFTDHQIDLQYGRLRKQLHALNDDVAKAMEKIDLKSVKKSKISEPDPAHTLDVCDKEIDNNIALLERLRKQYLQLQKRTSSIATRSKDELDEEISSTKQTIIKMKQKNKQMMLKNKNIGNEIMNTDQLYDEIRRLENQKQVLQRKRYKLHDKTEKVYESIANVQLKLEEISDDYSVAENYFEQYQNKNQKKEERKQIQYKFRHTKHCLEVTQKKTEITQNTKQQKYHIGLKNLQNQITKITGIDNKTRDTEIEIINSKKILNELERSLKEIELKRMQEELIKNQDQPVFFTEFQEENSNNYNNNNEEEERGVGDSSNNDKNGNKNNEVIMQESNVNKYERNKTENAQNKKQVDDEIDIEIEIEDKSLGKSKRERQQRLETSNNNDPEEQNDVIMDLDEKFKYQNRSMRNNSRINEKSTELDEQVNEEAIYDDHDHEMMDFQTKISEEKFKKKSKGQYDIAKDLSEVENQLKSIEKQNLARKNIQNYYDNNDNDSQEEND